MSRQRDYDIAPLGASLGTPLGAPLSAPEPPRAHGTWMISFVDLLSVLLTFMVMLYALLDVHAPLERHGTDSLAETIDWQRQLPASAARHGAETVRNQPALDLDYLAGVLDAAVAGEPVPPTFVRRDDRLIIALPLPASAAAGAAAPAPLLDDSEQRLLRVLARPLASVRNRLEIFGFPMADRSADADGAAANPTSAAWATGLDRALAAAAVLAAAGVERPVGCYALADPPAHRLPVETRDRRQPPASRIHLVILAGAGN